MRMEEYHKDMLLLVLVGLLAIEVGGLLLGLLAALALAGGMSYLAVHGLSLESIARFFMENPAALGLGTLIAHAFIAPARSYVVVRYGHKYGISWREELGELREMEKPRLLKLALVLAASLALELVGPLIGGTPLAAFVPQALEEYEFYVGVGTGALGYALALAYYVAEGLWLATTLELCSLRAGWGGLAALLVAWAPPHLLRFHGIDILNFLWALVVAVLLELTRRVGRNLVPVVALWTLLVLI